MDIIWAKFNRMVDGSKVTASVSCLNAQSNHIGRMKKHYEKCVKQPISSEPQPVSLSRTRRVTQLQSLFPNPRQLSKPSFQLLSSSVLIHHQPRSINSYVVRTSAATKDDLDDQIAEFLYGCGLPFSIIEHPLFKSLVSSLRLGYQLPSRQAVSNKLLDECHDKYQAIMKLLLNNKTVTMQQDGWNSV